MGKYIERDGSVDERGCFYFARALENRIDAKIGIIGCYVGGFGD